MKSSTKEIAEYCTQKVKKAGAYAEVYIIENTSLSARTRLKKMETVERSESTDLGLRILYGKKGKLQQSIVSSSDLNKKVVDNCIKTALEMAKSAPHDPYIDIVSKNQQVKNLKNLNIYDENEPSAERLIKSSKEAEEAAFSVNGVTNSEGAGTSYSKSDVIYATSGGFLQHYKSSYSSSSLSIVAGKGTSMETDYDYTVARYFKDLKPASELGKLAGKRAVQKLNPRKVKTCQVPIILESRVAREILDTLASAINGSAIARKTSFLKNKMGKQIFSKDINVIDDPFVKNGIASHPFDGEGIEGKKLNIIENGVLTTWLLDSRSAKQLKLKTNGRAVRGISSPPHPGHTNLYMENGKLSLKELFSDIKSGFYVTDAFGMGINMVTGDYSQGASGFWIENGKMTYSVSEVTIAGHLLDMFKKLTPANDLEFLYGINCPTLRIENMTVAGA